MTDYMNILNTRYLLKHRLGKGGMGEVYAALDRLTGREVALKLVQKLALDGTQELHVALTHEFEILASLRHPNIISVLDYGFTPDQ